MTSTVHLRPNRRRHPRRGAGRGREVGAAIRGVVVATGLVAALGLQLAGPRLQSRLADLVGIDALAPSVAPAAALLRSATPPCGPASAAYPMHACKVAVATAAGVAPAP